MAPTVASVLKRLEEEERRRKSGDEADQGEIATLRSQLQADDADLIALEAKVAALEAKPVEPPKEEPSSPVVEEPLPVQSDLEKLIPAGFKRVRYDDCTDPEPRNLYGEGLPYDYTAVSRIGKGTFEGQPARTCTILAGDHAGNPNALRCELGHDENRYGLASSTNHAGTFWLYQEGDLTVTIVRFELPANFPLSSGLFKTIFQIKDSNPGSENARPNAGPALEVQANENQLILNSFWHEPKLWRCAAHLSTPTTLVAKTLHSADPTKGWVDLSVLEYGKLVARSGQIACQNMATAGSNAGNYKIGDVVPSHYRGGLYMDGSLPTPMTVVHGATEIWK